MSKYTKIYGRKTRKEFNYTRSRDLLEESRLLEKQKGWAVSEELKNFLASNQL